MNRRDFLSRLGLTIAAVSLSPMLDLLPIEPARSSLVSLAEVDALLRSIYLPHIMRIANEPSPFWSRLSS